ncbi:MAG TPA: sigma-70 family RNA polymerase sigma factor [Planctomycetota bacterium]|nr:sigma-70 family RNA polymerase sigma factor [Planctomycetota bacterium]
MPDSEVHWVALVPQAQRGDGAARAALYELFARAVHAIVLAHVGAGQAEDVTQEVFCAVFGSLATLRDPAALPGFICTTARNTARDALRRRRRSPKSSPADELTASGPGPAASAEQRELAERVLGCIQGLPEAYRETLVLRLVAGLSGLEIAERTGLTHGSVRVNLTRGMAMLRPLLQEAGLP